MNQNRWIFILFAILTHSLIIGCGGDEEPEEISTPDITSFGRISGIVSPANASAEIQLLKNGQLIATTKADTNGNYVFANLEPDTYEVGVVAFSFKPLSPEKVTVIDGQTLTKNFTLEQLVTTLKGIVVSPDRIPIQNAIVTVESPKGQKTQKTNDLGIFSFDGVWADVELSVTIEAEGMEVQTVDVEAIKVGETVKLQLDMIALPDDNPDGPGSQVGNIAPNFTLPDINANLVSLSDYRGKSLVLLNFNRGQL